MEYKGGIAFGPFLEGQCLVSRVLDRELYGAIESSFYAASFSCSYQLLIAVSAARKDLAMGSSGLVAPGEMMANPVRSERS